MPTCGQCGNAHAFYELRPMENNGTCLSCLHRNAENMNTTTEQLRAELERVKIELKQRNDDCKNLMETARYAEQQLDAANRREAKFKPDARIQLDFRVR